MSKSNKEKKSKIPYLFFIFFGVIFTVDFFFVYISKKTWRGVVVEDAYEQGLKYNEVLAQAKKQEELGWKMAVSYISSGNKEGDLLINFQDENVQTIKDAKITVNFKRPTQSGHDFEEKVEFANGVYTTKLKFPLIGVWDFEIKAIRGEEIFQRTKRYVIK